MTKKEYMREYYARRKNDPEFMAQRRATNRERYRKNPEYAAKCRQRRKNRYRYDKAFQEKEKAYQRQKYAEKVCTAWRQGSGIKIQSVDLH
jgi:hypothetical protein